MGLAGYLALGLLCGRMLYASQRRKLIEKEEHRDPEGDPVEHFEEIEQPSTANASCLGGFLWPIVLPAHALKRVATRTITSSPPPTPQDRQRRSSHLHREIRRLEQDVEVGPPAPPAGESPPLPADVADCGGPYERPGRSRPD
ncbi:hypothetical protein AN216_17050 [Streptomyces oceani]|uniref:Uncharacterized protein n=1 Tax=Streptomyces oceani TaxID=1075402 RepID=A0A1E7KCR8_9ACTN|nr:hypothetical protein AN216_17050 [Streptomyces oceani]